LGGNGGDTDMAGDDSCCFPLPQEGDRRDGSSVIVIASSRGKPLSRPASTPFVPKGVSFLNQASPQSSPIARPPRRAVPARRLRGRRHRGAIRRRTCRAGEAQRIPPWNPKAGCRPPYGSPKHRRNLRQLRGRHVAPYLRVGFGVGAIAAQFGGGQFFEEPRRLLPERRPVTPSLRAVTQVQQLLRTGNADIQQPPFLVQAPLIDRAFVRQRAILAADDVHRTEL